MEKALWAMIEGGLPIKNYPDALATLQALNAAAESSYAALEAFLLSMNYLNDFLQIGVAKLHEELLPEDGPVSTVPYALEMLQEMRGRHQMAIVTVGFPALQASKLKKAGIDPSLFSKIEVIEEKNKKPSYQAIIDQAQLPSQEVVVCGDRFAIDLLPAQELGCHTVHLARGRGRHSKKAALTSGVGFAIEDWQGFARFLEQLEQVVHDIE